MEKGTLSEQQRAGLDRLEDLLESGSMYQLFDIEHTAESREIQEAYYALSREWHPDRFFRMDLGEDGDRIEFLFVGITHAYKVLSDPLKRRDYDRNELPRFAKRRSSRPAARRKDASSSSTKASKTSAASTAEGASTKRARTSEGPSTRGTKTSRSSGSRPSWRDRARSSRGRSQRSTSTATSSTSSASPDAERTRAKPRRTKVPVERLREEMRKKLAQARRYHKQGLEELEREEVVKAAASLYLATTYAPKNDEYKAAFAEANKAARKIQARQYIQQAEASESYQRVKEAISHYRKAVEFDPTNHKASYRLALLIGRYEEDEREALKLLREAVRADPDNAEYRVALGNLYSEIGMALNAQREFRHALKHDKGNEEAKAGLKRVR